jgi:hypothetical protein
MRRRIAGTAAHSWSDMYKTLVIAPRHPDLLMADDEVMQVVNTLDAKLLQGAQATITGLLAILREGWDIVWLVTHANEQGWYLSDGLVNASEMTTMVRSCGAILTVMNTCSSYEVAHTIHRELGTAFVCTIRPVPDRTAFITGTVFAQKIAAGLDFQTAYEAAKPGQNSTYTFLAARGTVMASPYDHRPQAGAAGDEISMIKDSLRRLEALVSGNPQWNVTGVVPELRDIRTEVRTLVKQVENLIADFADMRANQLFNRRLLVGLSTISGALLLTVVILLWQRGGL